jgi:hypothetical protein
MLGLYFPGLYYTNWIYVWVQSSGPIPIACANFSAWYENSIIQLDNVKSTTQ